MSKGVNQGTVSKVYYDVIDEVIQNVADVFTDEGADEAILQDLKAMWKKKLEDTKALEPYAEEKKYIYKPNPSSGNYVRVQQHSRPGQPLRIVSGGVSGGPHRVQRVISTNSQPIYRQQVTGDGINSGSSSNIVYRAAPRNENTVGRLHVQHRTEGGGTKNIVIRQGNNMSGQSRPVTRVIQQGQNPQVIVRSSDPSRQGVIRGMNVIHSQPNQLDGALDEEDDDSLSSDTESEQSEPEEQNPTVEEDPLGSGDDIDGASDGETFETDNVVVCQFDKIQRVRNKWRFTLKDGIMSLKGKDHVFQKANGDAEW